MAVRRYNTGVVGTHKARHGGFKPLCCLVGCLVARGVKIEGWWRCEFW